MWYFACFSDATVQLNATYANAAGTNERKSAQFCTLYSFKMGQLISKWINMKSSVLYL